MAVRALRTLYLAGVLVLDKGAQTGVHASGRARRCILQAVFVHKLTV